LPRDCERATRAADADCDLRLKNMAPTQKNSAMLTNLVRTLVPRPVRTWLRSPSQSAKYLVDSAAFSLGLKTTLRFPDDGWSIICHPHAYRCAYESQILDADQNQEFCAFRSYCSKQMLLFDIGAHFGIFSLAAASAGGRAVAVDPSPMAARMIATQAALNGLTGNIHVLCSAAGSADGSLELLSAGTFSYGYFRAAKDRLKRDLTKVRSVTIDSLASEFGAPTHIKIDVEGYEAEVLRGAHKTLNSCSPILFLELHNDIIRAEGGDPDSVLKQLAHAGYTFHTLRGDEASRTSLVRAPIVRLIAKRDPDFSSRLGSGNI